MKLSWWLTAALFMGLLIPGDPQPEARSKYIELGLDMGELAEGLSELRNINYREWADDMAVRDRLDATIARVLNARHALVYSSTRELRYRVGISDIVDEVKHWTARRHVSSQELNALLDKIDRIWKQRRLDQVIAE